MSENNFFTSLQHSLMKHIIKYQIMHFCIIENILIMKKKNYQEIFDEFTHF